MFIRSERSWLGTLASGLIGVGTVFALQRWGRARSRHVPALDRLGAKSLARGLRAAGWHARARTRRRFAWGADLVANTVFFSAIAAGRRRGWVRRGLFWGALAGLGVIALAPRWALFPSVSLRRPLRARRWAAGIYAAGGLASAGASRLLVSNAY